MVLQDLIDALSAVKDRKQPVRIATLEGEYEIGDLVYGRTHAGGVLICSDEDWDAE